MKGWPLPLALLAVGCAPKPPEAVVSRPTPESSVVHPEPPRPAPEAAPAPWIALVEPYLVPVSLPMMSAPPAMRGRIVPDVPLSQVPILPPAVSAEPAPTPPPALNPTKPAPTPAPKASPAPSTISPGVVRLFEEERSRRVDDARDRLAAATVRATQTAAEAKRIAGFVKEGFVAQKQADAADAAAKQAAADQADAQKVLDDAQRRLRDVRRDLETAVKRVALAPSGFRVAQAKRPAPAFQAVPNVYRLAVLGIGPTSISLQGGTLGRRLDPAPGEAGAWLVRTVDPARLRVGVGARPAKLVVRSLPDATPPAKV